MPDTGAPWNLPFPAPSDLVRDAPVAFEDLAVATAAGLDAASKLISVKHVIKTDTQTQSTAAGANFAVSGLSITHSIATAGNILIISASFGIAASSDGRAPVGIAVFDGTTGIALGDAAGARTQVTAGMETAGTATTRVTSNPGFLTAYAPGTGSRTYTVRAINTTAATNTIYINRPENDDNNARQARASSSLVIMEVAP